MWWLNYARKPRLKPRTVSARTAGTINPITRKRHLSVGYEPSPIRHSNAVISSCYEHRINIVGDGPLINPVQLDRDRRSGTRDNPLDPARDIGRIRCNLTLSRRRPREMPEAAWRDVFGQLRSNRDRALLSMDVSCAAYAAELLGACGVDLDWGNQLQ